MSEFDRITFDQSIIVSQIASGADHEEILGGYPDLESEDIHQTLQNAAASRTIG